MQLVDAPFDILLAITECLDCCDLLSFDLICKRLHGVALRHLLRCVILRYDLRSISSFCSLLRRKPECARLIIEIKLVTSFSKDYNCVELFTSSASYEEYNHAFSKLLGDPVMRQLAEAISGMANLRHGTLSHCNRLSQGQEDIFIALRRCTKLDSLEFLHNSRGSHRPIYTHLQGMATPLVSLRIGAPKEILSLHSIDNEDFVPILRQWRATLRELVLHGATLAPTTDVWPALLTFELRACRVPRSHMDVMFPNVRKFTFFCLLGISLSEPFVLGWKHLQFLRVPPYQWIFAEAPPCSVTNLQLDERIYLTHLDSSVARVIEDVKPAMLQLDIYMDAVLRLLGPDFRKNVDLSGLIALDLLIPDHLDGRVRTLSRGATDAVRMGEEFKTFFTELTSALGNLPSLQCVQLRFCDTSRYVLDGCVVLQEAKVNEHAAGCFASLPKLRLLVLYDCDVSWWWTTDPAGNSSGDGSKIVRVAGGERGRLLDFHRLAESYEDDPEEYVQNTLREVNL